jgi:curved DNA-binding protein CbpA
MAIAQLVDHYEILQVSPHADRETIERIYRFLAQRFHPDNQESGNPDLFMRVVEAHKVLTDPVQRARYDVHYEEVRESRWRIFDQETVADDMAGDQRMRAAILGILYTARRTDAERPGVGIMDLERLLGCPEVHMNFHLWYLRESGLVQRLETGLLAITVHGVDRVIETGSPVPERPLLTSGRASFRGKGNGSGSGSGSG